jgi:biopolymer transport protein ExbD
MNAIPPATAGQGPTAEVSQGLPAGNEIAKKRKKKVREGYEQPEINIVAMMDMMTIILIYLLKSYASDPVQISPAPEQSLPLSSSMLSPKEAAIQVAITDRAILVDNSKVATIRNGRVLVDFKKDQNPASMWIVPLFDSLKKKGDVEKLIAKYNKDKPFKGLLTIISDKKVPFRLLTEVLYTAGQAEFGAYKFAVIKKAS